MIDKVFYIETKIFFNYFWLVSYENILMPGLRIDLSSAEEA